MDLWSIAAFIVFKQNKCQIFGNGVFFNKHHISVLLVIVSVLHKGVDCLVFDIHYIHVLSASDKQIRVVIVVKIREEDHAEYITLIQVLDGLCDLLSVSVKHANWTVDVVVKTHYILIQSIFNNGLNTLILKVLFFRFLKTKFVISIGLSNWSK